MIIVIMLLRRIKAPTTLGIVKHIAIWAAAYIIATNYMENTLASLEFRKSGKA